MPAYDGGPMPKTVSSEYLDMNAGKMRAMDPKIAQMAEIISRGEVPAGYENDGWDTPVTIDVPVTMYPIIRYKNLKRDQEFQITFDWWAKKHLIPVTVTNQVPLKIQQVYFNYAKESLAKLAKNDRYQIVSVDGLATPESAKPKLGFDQMSMNPPVDYTDVFGNNEEENDNESEINDQSNQADTADEMPFDDVSNKDGSDGSVDGENSFATENKTDEAKGDGGDNESVENEETENETKVDGKDAKENGSVGTKNDEMPAQRASVDDHSQQELATTQSAAQTTNTEGVTKNVSAGAVSSDTEAKRQATVEKSQPIEDISDKTVNNEAVNTVDQLDLSEILDDIDDGVNILSGTYPVNVRLKVDQDSSVRLNVLLISLARETIKHEIKSEIGQLLLINLSNVDVITTFVFMQLYRDGQITRRSFEKLCLAFALNQARPSTVELLRKAKNVSQLINLRVAKEDAKGKKNTGKNELNRHVRWFLFLAFNSNVVINSKNENESGRVQLTGIRSSQDPIQQDLRTIIGLMAAQMSDQYSLAELNQLLHGDSMKQATKEVVDSAYELQKRIYTMRMTKVGKQQLRGSHR